MLTDKQHTTTQRVCNAIEADVSMAMRGGITLEELGTLMAGRLVKLRAVLLGELGLVEGHADSVPAYVLGSFVVRCSCDETFSAQSPDDASAAWQAHADEQE